MNNALFANPQLFQAYQNDPGMAYGQALMQQGASAAPVRSPLEGLARALQAGVGGFTQSKVRDKYEKQDEGYRNGLTAALQGGDVLAALQASGDPTLQQMGLDARLKQALNPADDPLVKVYDPQTKTERYTKSSQAIGQQADGPAQPKMGEVRKFRQGNQEVAQQWDGSQWAPLGQGAAFAPPDTQSVSVNLPKSINAGDVKTMQIGAEATSQAQEVLPMFAIARESAKNFPQSGPLGKGALLYERGKALLGLPNNAQSGEVLQAMQTRLGSMLRIPGSGATSDMEMSLYMQGVPSLLNTQQGNIALADIGEKLMKRRIQNYKALQDYIVQHDSSAGYQPNETPVLTPEETQMLLNGGAQAAPAAAEAAPQYQPPKPGDIQEEGGLKFRFKGGDPGNQSSWEQVQ